MQTLRYQTQDLLRQKVSGHYQLFMRGTEDIQHVEQVRALCYGLLATTWLRAASSGRIAGDEYEALPHRVPRSNATRQSTRHTGHRPPPPPRGPDAGVAPLPGRRLRHRALHRARPLLHRRRRHWQRRRGPHVDAHGGRWEWGHCERTAPRPAALDGPSRVRGCVLPELNGGSSPQPASSPLTKSIRHGHDASRSSSRLSVPRAPSPAPTKVEGSSSSSSSHLQHPKWVASSVEELERLCVERQRSAAVALIEKARPVPLPPLKCFAVDPPLTSFSTMQ